MFSSLPLALLLLAHAHNCMGSGSDGNFCCPKKIVNGLTYSYIGNRPDLASLMNCSTDCMYTLPQNPDQMYCFKPGHHLSECAADSDCKCGQEKPKSGKIVGGDPTDTNKWPWYVYVRQENHLFPGLARFICGASLITAKFVLTAAHCVAALVNKTVEYGEEEAPRLMMTSAADIKVYLGVNNSTGANTANPDLQGSGVETIVIHEKYSFAEFGYDIALLLLTTKIDQSLFPPVCLPTPDQYNTFVGSTATSIGYGALSSGGILPNTLMEVNETVIDLGSCNEFTNKTFGHPLANGSVCTETPGKSTCQGDSGGPLMVYNDHTNQYLLIGITSYGGICGEGASIYTSAAYYRDWIETTMAKLGGSGMRCY